MKRASDAGSSRATVAATARLGAIRRAAIRLGAGAATELRRIDQLDQLPVEVALGFRPRLRPEVKRGPRTLAHGRLKVTLDAFEAALLDGCDSRLSIGDLLARREGAAAAQRAIAFFAALARHGLLVTYAEP